MTDQTKIVSLEKMKQAIQTIQEKTNYFKNKKLALAEKERKEKIARARLRALQDKDRFGISDLDFDDISEILQVRYAKEDKEKRTPEQEILYEHSKRPFIKSMIERSRI